MFLRSARNIHTKFPEFPEARLLFYGNTLFICGSSEIRASLLKSGHAAGTYMQLFTLSKRLAALTSEYKQQIRENAMANMFWQSLCKLQRNVFHLSSVMCFRAFQTVWNLKLKRDISALSGFSRGSFRVCAVLFAKDMNAKVLLEIFRSFI